ncbi:hypothetical protein [Gloeothece verrucosa]|uniref:Uncharacterized protein n=1 Tax=Gloeothece verrucosa (strain PCC 7822) TaxID=497965 RepID=E0UE76_GLOV7|nr:hypothetical protein [Gloeothece verrucosa]ADN14201.1 hypothetical protein Cyan7822_2222 [Gloeothece verrucosa PCC 7822]
MSVNLDDFLIEQQELESLIDGNLVTQISLDIYRGVFLKNKKSLFSTFLTEIFTFILILIGVIPLAIIVIRNRVKMPEGSTEINQILIILAIICLGLMLLINIYWWKQSHQFKSLAILVDKTEQYNHLIQSIKLVKALELSNALNTAENWESQHQDLMEALRVIKDSLIQGFTVEKIIRKHKALINNQYDLLTSIEANLTALMTFDLSNPSSNYRDLLQDAIQIGMTVHKEMIKLRNKQD